MAQFSMSTRVTAQVEKVFDLFSDLRNCAGRIKAIKRIEVLTPGPIGVGTHFKETRVMFKKEATEEMHITAFELNKSYTVSCNSCGALFTSTFRFQPDDGGTLVTFDFNCQAQSFFAKLMKPLSWLMMGPMKKCIQQDLNDLKAVAEGAGAAKPS